MTVTEFENLFTKICAHYGVKLFLRDPTQDKDNGYAKWNEIHLSSRYSCISVYRAVAFHELGHAIINMKRAKGIKLYKVHSIFNNEFNAWWLAQRLHLKHTGKPFNRKMGEFALECLKTHSTTHYAFKDTFKDKARRAKTARKTEIRQADSDPVGAYIDAAEKKGWKFDSAAMDKIYHTETIPEMKLKIAILGVSLTSADLAWLCKTTTYHAAFWPHTKKRFECLMRFVKSDPGTKAIFVSDGFRAMLKAQVAINEETMKLHYTTPGERKEAENWKKLLRLSDRLAMV